MTLLNLLSAVLAGCAHEDTVLAKLSSYDNMEIDEDGLNAAICERASGATSSGGACPETELPKNMSSPLVCLLPKTAAAGQPLCLQCAVKPGVTADSALLHYRKPGEGDWSSHSVPMPRTPSGWFRGTIPAAVMRGLQLDVYFEALDGVDRVAMDGEWNSRHVVRICGGQK